MNHEAPMEWPQKGAEGAKIVGAGGSLRPCSPERGYEPNRAFSQSGCF